MKTVKAVREILEIKNELIRNNYDVYDAYNLIDDVIRVIAKNSKLDNSVNEIVDILYEDVEFMDKYVYELYFFACHVLKTDEALNIWKKTDDMEA